MKYEINISDKADRDLRDIFEYISFELNESDNAVKQIKRLNLGIDSLECFPKRFRKYKKDQYVNRELRIMQIDSYCVFYYVDDENLYVIVSRVIYGGRNIKNLI